MYRNLKLDRGVTAQKSTDVLTRQDTLYLFYNLLSTNTKEGTPYINKLGYSLNAAGEVDRVALVNGVMEGRWWRPAAGSSPSPSMWTAPGVPGRAASSAKSIQNNDIVYWSESMQTCGCTPTGGRHDPGTEPHPLQPHIREGGRPDL